MKPQGSASPAPLPFEEDQILFSPSSNSDSSSDVPMSAEPDSKLDESRQPEFMTGDQSETTRDTLEEETMAIIWDDASKKRKPHETTDLEGGRLLSSKKVKRGYDGVRSPSADHNRPNMAFLPAEIWHRIFTFSPPRALGNLLVANKLFNVYLDPSAPFQVHIPRATAHSHAVYLKPDAIWQISRRRFWPRMPSPLQGNTELSMWQLACQKKCQFCGRRELTGQIPPVDQWHSGPGADGVKTIWTFALKSCGPCLLKSIIKVRNRVKCSLYGRSF